jgi:hypothetical protein
MDIFVAPFDKSIHFLFQAVNKHFLFLSDEAQRQPWAVG